MHDSLFVFFKEHGKHLCFALRQPSLLTSTKKETFTILFSYMSVLSISLTGKWHLGLNCEHNTDHCHHPSVHGFEHFYGIPMTNLRDCQPGHGSVFYNVRAHIPYRALGTALATLLLLHAKGLVLISRRLALCLGATLFMTIALFFLWVLTFPYFNCFLMRGHEVVEQPYVSENLTQKMTKEAIEFLERSVNIACSYLKNYSGFSST